MKVCMVSWKTRHEGRSSKCMGVKDREVGKFWAKVLLVLQTWDCIKLQERETNNLGLFESTWSRLWPILAAGTEQLERLAVCLCTLDSLIGQGMISSSCSVTIYISQDGWVKTRHILGLPPRCTSCCSCMARQGSIPCSVHHTALVGYVTSSSWGLENPC